MRSLIKKEDGSVIVMVALMIVVLLGFTALAVDGGNLYARHTRLQDIADSMALAAAMEKNGNGNDKTIKKSAAFARAQDYAETDGLKVQNPNNNLYKADIYLKDDKGTMQLSFSDDANQVTVDLSTDTKLYFAGVLGINSSTVKVSATAIRGTASKQTGHLVPIAFFYDEYEKNTKYEMTLAPQDGQSGNYGFLEYNNDPNQFKNYLKNGYGGTLAWHQEVPTYTGVTAGPVEEAIQFRIDSCIADHDPDCTYLNYKPDCPRIVYVPIVSNFFVSNGKSYVVIEGFAKFFIENYDKLTKVLTGYFLEELNNSEVIGVSSEFMIGSVHLIK